MVRPLVLTNLLLVVVLLSESKSLYCFGERIHWFRVWTEYQTEGRFM